MTDTNEYAPLICQTIDGWDFVWTCRTCHEIFETYTDAVNHLRERHMNEVKELKKMKGKWNPTRRED